MNLMGVYEGNTRHIQDIYKTYMDGYGTKEKVRASPDGLTPQTMNL